MNIIIHNVDIAYVVLSDKPYHYPNIIEYYKYISTQQRNAIKMLISRRRVGYIILQIIICIFN